MEKIEVEKLIQRSIIAKLSLSAKLKVWYHGSWNGKNYCFTIKELLQLHPPTALGFVLTWTKAQGRHFKDKTLTPRKTGKK